MRPLEAGGAVVRIVTEDVHPDVLDAALARAGSDPAFSAVVDAAVRTGLTAKAGAGLLR